MTPVAALTATRAVAWDAALEETLSGPAAVPGVVHSRYRRVINVLLPGGRLIALASCELDDAPWTIRLPQWDQVASRIGANVLLSAGSIQLAPGLDVHLDPDRAWSPRPTDLSCLTLDDLEISHRALQAAVPEPVTPFGRAGGELLAHGLDSLHTALVNSDGPDEISDTLGRVVGLGEGLTPSGDDALVGLLLVAAQPGTYLGSLLPELCDAVDRHADRTTALSATTLRAAARGRARQSLHDLLADLAGGPAQAAIERVLAIGHSSGADLLRGFALALAVEQDLRNARGQPPSGSRTTAPPREQHERERTTSPHQGEEP